MLFFFVFVRSIFFCPKFFWNQFYPHPTPLIPLVMVLRRTITQIHTRTLATQMFIRNEPGLSMTRAQSITSPIIPWATVAPPLAGCICIIIVCRKSRPSSMSFAPPLSAKEVTCAGSRCRCFVKLACGPVAMLSQGADGHLSRLRLWYPSHQPKSQLSWIFCGCLRPKAKCMLWDLDVGSFMYFPENNEGLKEGIPLSTFSCL